MGARLSRSEEATAEGNLMVIKHLYLVRSIEDPNCTPDVLGVFTDLWMAMQAMVVLHNYGKEWRFLRPQGNEVLRIERDDHVVLIETVVPTCLPNNVLTQHCVKPSFYNPEEP